MQGYKSEFRSTLLKVTEPIFIGIIVDLMSLGPFCCILLFCYDSITKLVMRYPAVIIIWLCLGQPYIVHKLLFSTYCYKKNRLALATTMYS